MTSTKTASPRRCATLASSTDGTRDGAPEAALLAPFEKGTSMSEFDVLAAKAEKDFDLGEFARTVRTCRSYRRFD